MARRKTISLLQLAGMKLKMKLADRRGSQLRYLFLDFDGVINVPYEPDTPEYEYALAHNFDFFRRDMVERVNRLCRDYGLQTVLTSSWRFSGLDYCRQVLYEAGFDRNLIIAGMTDAEDIFEHRDYLIYQWVLSHPQTAAIMILDDIPMPSLSEYEANTDFDYGYTEEKDREARRKLDRQIRNRPDRT
ncbi:MAG: hypothetical protein K6D03_10925 [Solobacterium sp.]|nr:hypothetical protein [Solobacterium sp.]